MSVDVKPAFTSAVLPALRRLVDDLPGQAARVARVVLDDPHRAARMPIADLAVAAETSEASVTRLAQRLGLSGYPALRIALASESGQDTGGGAPVAGDVTRGDDLATVRAKVLADLEASLRETSAALDDAALEAVATAVAAARRTLVVGIGASGIVATDLARKLERAGLVAGALTEYHDAVTSAVAVRPDDVVLAFSHSGATVDVVDPVRRAAARGATTVAVTSRPDSDLARAADHVLVSVAGSESAFRPAAMSSRSAQLYVVDVLFVAVVQRTYDAAEPMLTASWDALRARHPDRGDR
ncbi:MAG: MurR/RpiR family transcriptional regulator [Nocardioidaceae bacterium]|nr:MurR/RpiR family transcriptional regulator [Nocardioidaceae bacterium]